MAPTLKERYNQRQLSALQERAKAADTQLLTEQRAAILLLEKMDQGDLDKVSAIIQKLDTLKAPELPHLTQAIEQAQAELNKYTGGGPLSQAWSTLKTKMGIDNPVVKITTFADALERGMSQIPQILKNNGVNLAKADTSKSLSSLLTTSATGKQGGEGGSNSFSQDSDKTNAPKDNSPKPAMGAKSNYNVSGKGDDDEIRSHLPGPGGTAPTPARKPTEPKHTGGQDPPPKAKPGIKPAAAKKSSAPPQGDGFSKSQEDWFDKGQAEGHDLDEASNGPSGEQKIKNIINQIRKALAPKGFFGAFKKIPYIDSNALAQELVQAPIKAFANVAQKIQKGAKAAEIAPDMKDQIQGQGQAQTSHAEPAAPAKQTGQTQPGQPPKPSTGTSDTTGAGQQPPTAADQERGGGSEVKPQEVNQKTFRRIGSKIDQVLKSPNGKFALAKVLLDAGIDPEKFAKLADKEISQGGSQQGNEKAA